MVGLVAEEAIKRLNVANLEDCISWGRVLGEVIWVRQWMKMIRIMVSITISGIADKIRFIFWGFGLICLRRLGALAAVPLLSQKMAEESSALQIKILISKST